MISHLRLQRERRGWSRATLAKVLGTTVATVAKWEDSLLIPPPSIQEMLHLLFGANDEVFEHTSKAADATQDQGLAFLLLPHCPPSLSSPQGPAHGIGLYDPMLPPPLTGTNRLI
jgi:transcriptional regulator with XRE-family HTH domain